MPAFAARGARLALRAEAADRRSGSGAGGASARAAPRDRRGGPARAAFAVPGPLFMGGSAAAEIFAQLARVQQATAATFVEFPRREAAGAAAAREPPLVRVTLYVEFRVHSRQMLCIGGSAIPFGWSFLSIAKVPMAWTAGDVWAVTVELPAGARVEYKYVILEEQDWTQQVNAAAEGRVAYAYRTREAAGAAPPDVQTITRQMAIVAWQPGPNRVLQVPPEAELAALRLAPGGPPAERAPPAVVPAPGARGAARAFGQPGGAGAAARRAEAGAAAAAAAAATGAPAPRVEEVSGVWERVGLDAEGAPFMERRDVWGEVEPEDEEGAPPPGAAF
jgi:hypothetical protein